MWFYKTAAAALLLASLCGVRGDKKIELQDIEEDNLKSENVKTPKSEPEYEPRPTIVVTGTGTGRAADPQPLDYIKNGFLRLYETPVQVQQQPRYVQQYAVTEGQERPSGAPETAVQKPEYASSAQTMLGYLSNVPMQVLYIPQYYAEPTHATSHAGVQYVAPTSSQANTQPGVQYVIGNTNAGSYRVQEPASEPQQSYVEIPTYLTPSGKGSAGSPAQYASPQVTYVTYGPPQVTVPATSAAGHSGPPAHHAPVYATAAAAPFPYAMPLLAYSQPMAPPPQFRPYHPSYSHYETNSVEDAPEPPREPPSPPSTERPYTRPTPDSSRYYTSPRLLKGESQPPQVPELPPPSPLIYQSQPAHLAGIPKVLPFYRPSTKPVYSHISGNLIPGGFTSKHRDPGYSFAHRKRPSSLLDSYIPSSVQLEYMKRGLGQDPISTYEALSSGRYPGGYAQPRQLERGFLPNQMYPTAAGGVTYGHYKRAPGAGGPPKKVNN